MKRFSVIIPVYNSEEYLSNCVQSVLSQTFKDYEIILINDGSKDNSAHICDQLAQDHSNIKVLHQDNVGAAGARNSGIRIASGEYLIFLDSDDFYDENIFFETVDKFITEEGSPTAVSFPINKYYTAKEGIYITPNNNFDENILNANTLMQNLKHQITNACLPISASNNIIKRKYILEQNLFFREKITGEDIEWSLRLYSDDFQIRYLGINPYVYRKDNQSSVTKNISEKNIRDIFDFVKSYTEKFFRSDKKSHKLLLNYLAYQYTILLGLLSKINNPSSKRELRKELKKYLFLLNYDLHPKVKLVKKTYKVLGFHLTLLLLNIYVSRRK